MGDVSFFKHNEHSLIKQYIRYAVVTVVIILVTTLWVSYVSYNSFKEETNALIKKESQKLIFAIEEELIFIEHILRFIGNKILLLHNKSRENIFKEIRPHKKTFKDEAFSWHVIYYISPEGYLNVNSLDPDKEPIYMPDKRAWIAKAKERPWRLQFSKPGIGLLSGDYLIPSGIGIYDKAKSFFAGYIGVGISVGKLTSELVSFINDDICFIVYDDDKNILLSSEPTIKESSVNKEILPSSVPKANNFHNSSDIIKLKQPLYINEFSFEYFIYSDRFGFFVLVGKNETKYYKQLRHEIAPTLGVYGLFGILFTSLLLILGYQIVKPILELGRIADDISKGKKAEPVTYNAREVNLLSKQLKNISLIHQRLRYQKNRLSIMNGKLSNTNEFIKSNMSFLSHELINPITSIIGFSNLLKNKAQSIGDPQVIDFVNMLNKAAIHQHKQLNFFLKLFKFQKSKRKPEEKPINLKEIIDWNLSMISHHIINKDIKTSVEINKNLILLGDEIMIGQLAQNLASNGAKYNKIGGSLKITAKVNKKGEIELSFIDSGIGIEKKELKNIFKIFNRSKIKDKKIIGYGIGLAYAKQCVDLHDGKIKVLSKPLEGANFKVIFPKNRTVAY
jgi:signal transduction histidine kinase